MTHATKCACVGARGQISPPSSCRAKGQVTQKDFAKYLVVLHLLLPPLLELLKLYLELVLHLPLFVQHLLVTFLQQSPLRHHFVLQGRADTQGEPSPSLTPETAGLQAVCGSPLDAKVCVKSHVISSHFQGSDSVGQR